jgi:hypothetical protein
MRATCTVQLIILDEEYNLWSCPACIFPITFCLSSVLHPMQRFMSFTPFHIGGGGDFFSGDEALAIHARYESNADFYACPSHNCYNWFLCRSSHSSSMSFSLSTLSFSLSSLCLPSLSSILLSLDSGTFWTWSYISRDYLSFELRPASVPGDRQGPKIQ